mgnify:CR=1 FL=1
MDTPYSSSNAITSSNRSRESTSRSSLKRVASVISTFSWFNCSLMIAATSLTCFCSPYAFHYCVSDTLVYYFVVSGVFTFPSQLLSVLTFCISSLFSPNYFDYQSIYLQYTTRMLFCQHLFFTITASKFIIIM